MIPKQILFMCEGVKYNDIYLKKWQNTHPKYKIIKIQKYMLRSFIAKYNPMYSEIFELIDVDLLRNEFVQLVWLVEEGGFSIHTDLEPLENLDIFTTESLVLTKNMDELRERSMFSNRFIASEKKNKLLDDLLNKYTTYYLIGNVVFIKDYWRYSSLLEKKNLKNQDICYVNQQSGSFFYDAYYSFKKKRIMNDLGQFYE